MPFGSESPGNRKGTKRMAGSSHNQVIEALSGRRWSSNANPNPTPNLNPNPDRD